MTFGERVEEMFDKYSKYPKDEALSRLGDLQFFIQTADRLSDYDKITLDVITEVKRHIKEER